MEEMNPVKGHVQSRDKRKSHNSPHTDRHNDCEKEIKAQGAGRRWGRGRGGFPLPADPGLGRQRPARTWGEREASFPKAGLGKNPGVCERERPEPPGRAAKVIFPNSASRRRFDERSPTTHQRSGGQMTSPLLTDQGSQLPISKPKKKTRGWGRQ